MLPFSRFARYFVEVAQSGSLRKAAEELHVSASAIDRQILLAERELETELFERLPSGLKLTAAGELLLDDLRRWRKEYRRTVERFDELQGLRRGHVSIAVIDALSDGLVANTVAQVGAAYPQLSFDLQVVENRRVADLVAASEVDFGLMLDPTEHGGLEIRALVDVPLGAVVPPGHPLTASRDVTFGSLLDYRQLVPAAPLIVHERTRVLYASHQAEGTESVSCNSIRMMRSLIRGGAGIGVLSLLDVASDVESGALAFVPLRGRKVRPLALALCVARRRQLSRAAQMVMQQVIAAMEKLGETASVASESAAPARKRK
ncbi:MULTISPECIES: LysR family transcriptional regulator [unclassified Paraburkholderia]|uniref:LysR family transcriptional regulator n=1 Tax=unclassified Paraburkholderia TaxID=2615204 RepID=UPI00286F8CD2|nr:MULTISPECIES: LysR family transcriptional regulator [unclassified Paraburkholderia]